MQTTKPPQTNSRSSGPRALSRAARLAASVCVVAAGLIASLADAAPSPPPTAAPVDVVFVLDNSGSMRAHDPSFLTRQAVLDFAKALAARAESERFDARVGVVLFDEAADLALPLTPLSTDRTAAVLAPALAGLDYSGQRTRSADGVERALYTLRQAERPGARQAIILLTDGELDTGDAARDRESSAWLRDDLAGESLERGIPIFGLAFTDRADYQLLQAVARKTGAAYYRAGRADELGGITAQVLTRLLSGEAARPAASNAKAEAEVGSVPDPLQTRPTPDVAAAPLVQPTGDAANERLGWLPWAILLAAAGLYGLRTRSRAAVNREKRDPAASSIVPAAQLLDVGGVLGETGRAIPLQAGRTRIGRDPHSDIAIHDDTISSEHAVIDFEGGRYWLEDLRSTNGTKHGDVRLARGERVALKGGDHVRFADVDLMFVFAGYVPGGATVLLPSTSTPPAHWRTARPAAPVRTAPEAAKAVFDDQPGDVFRDCLDYHLARVAELSPAFAQFVTRAFDDEMRAAVRMAASELVKTANRGDCVAIRAYTRDRIRYVLCGAPGGMDVAARAYQTAHGGFSRFLSEQIDSETFRADRCQVLAVLTFGRAAGEPWVSLSIVPDEGRDPRIDLLSFELLTESERQAMASRPTHEVSQSGRS